jgi:hypothetical protein
MENREGISQMSSQREDIFVIIHIKQFYLQFVLLKEA